MNLGSVMVGNGRVGLRFVVVGRMGRKAAVLGGLGLGLDVTEWVLVVLCGLVLALDEMLSRFSRVIL